MIAPGWRTLHNPGELHQISSCQFCIAGEGIGFAQQASRRAQSTLVVSHQLILVGGVKGRKGGSCYAFCDQSAPALMSEKTGREVLTQRLLMYGHPGVAATGWDDAPERGGDGARRRTLITKLACTGEAEPSTGDFRMVTKNYKRVVVDKKIDFENSQE